ncbi:TetR/AcrR family transcriptional regulator [Saccharopolyspora sp. NFXS83]|uniref:TetR/AcrR family transcriptional regulator n=1 Tax=Saccharopolyspora sp. NFXS83 TaxID=2993560 RepID=UPI00224B8579|nr:TetR/AcrR family transcriptional regulator [Saccharopolyspora sp. NFXS83]MCX2730539.1 TetR/AcrR family transcriptional regulator [Saccharopolyspora sp. NFXS83]
MSTFDEPGKPGRWAGKPPADRVAERRALLLDAALDLLGTEGWSGTSVRAVCQHARLNPRYFYESFPDLNALVIALYDRLIDDLHTEVRTAAEAAGNEPHERVRAVVDTTTRFVAEDRRRARVLYVEALGNEALNRRRIETGHLIARYVEADATRGAPGDPVVAITAAVLVGGFSELLMSWLDGHLPIDRDRLVDDATTLFTGLGDTAATIATRRGRG